MRLWAAARPGIPRGGKLEKILQDEMAVLRGDALGMKLHAMRRIGLVRRAHHEPVGLRDHVERARDRGAVDDERVIARGFERTVDAAKYASALVGHFGEFAIHRYRRAHDLAAKRLTHRLQAEADAEHRDGRRGFFDEIETDAGFVRCAGTGREHNRVRIGLHYIPDGHLVVAMHDDVRPQLAEVMDEIEGEAVVIVDEDNHAPGQRFRPVLRGDGEGVKEPHFGGSMSGIGVSMSSKRLLSSSLEIDGTTRVRSLSFCPSRVSCGNMSTVASTSHCASRNGASARTSAPSEPA